jgi:HD-GYP domain-containing protein (c-di-GMP phosphodiesterase class II)
MNNMIEHIQAAINAGKASSDYQDYQRLIERLDTVFSTIAQGNPVKKLSVEVILKPIYSSYQQYIGFISDGTKQNHSPARRAVNTAILTNFITGQLGLLEHQCLQITEGALFHDIGMLLIPKDILNKQEPLSDSELRHITAHPVHGYKLLKEKLQDTVQHAEEVSSIILQHHERCDGNGYPQRLAKETIGLGARVVAIADAYAAMVSEKAYRNAVSAHSAMRTLLAACAGRFDNAIFKTFIQSIGMYPPGSIVLLNNGEIARVVEPDALMQPRVHIIVDQGGKHTIYNRRNSELVRLSAQKELSITKAFEPEEISRLEGESSE